MEKIEIPLFDGAKLKIECNKWSEKPSKYVKEDIVSCKLTFEDNEGKDEVLSIRVTKTVFSDLKKETVELEAIPITNISGYSESTNTLYFHLRGEEFEW